MLKIPKVWKILQKIKVFQATQTQIIQQSPHSSTSDINSPSHQNQQNQSENVDNIILQNKHINLEYKIINAQVLQTSHHNNAALLGIAGMSDWSPDLVFKDLFIKARAWIFQKQGAPYGSGNARLWEFMPNGHPKKFLPKKNILLHQSSVAEL